MTMPEAQKTVAVHTYKHPLLHDIYLGAVRGDFAPEMGGAGRLTQVVVGFMPFFGTVCALRDMLADARLRDWLGTGLNAAACLPFIGGLSKVAAVLRAVRRTGRVLKAGRILASEVPAAGPSSLS